MAMLNNQRVDIYIINRPWLGMVYATYKNGDDWAMVQMALFYRH